MKLLLTNLVYGEDYANTFLNLHLKSFLDETNIPSRAKDELGYVIYTDEKTLPILKKHPNVQKLSSIVGTELAVLMVETGFDRRYTLLVETFRMSVQRAIAEGAEFVSPMVADLVVAQGYIPKLFSRFDAGYDSVFVLPPRSAYESAHGAMDSVDGALPAPVLWDVVYRNLHPLWVACHWHSPQFTKMPFSLLWNSGTGILAKSFSITPIAFRPDPEMAKTTQVIDVEIPGMCKNPYWATDWNECPIAGVEFLRCYFPPFKNRAASIHQVSDWAKKCLHPSQRKLVQTSLYYPSKSEVRIMPQIQEYADRIAEGML